MQVQVSLKVFISEHSDKPCFERIVNCDSNFDYVCFISSMFALFGTKCKIIYEVVL